MSKPFLFVKARGESSSEQSKGRTSSSWRAETFRRMRTKSAFTSASSLLDTHIGQIGKVERLTHDEIIHLRFCLAACLELKHLIPVDASVPPSVLCPRSVQAVSSAARDLGSKSRIYSRLPDSGQVPHCGRGVLRTLASIMSRCHGLHNEDNSSVWVPQVLCQSRPEDVCGCSDQVLFTVRVQARVLATFQVEPLLYKIHTRTNRSGRCSAA